MPHTALHMRVTILRGISGSGKSTWTKTHAKEALIISTDAYFIQPDGTYRFEAEKLSLYHRQAFRAFLQALEEKEPWIVVDNTNICAWEFAPYVAAAEAFDYTVELFTFDCPLETALARKQLLPERKLQQKFKDLRFETAHLPRHFTEINRVIPCDFPLL